MLSDTKRNTLRGCLVHTNTQTDQQQHQTLETMLLCHPFLSHRLTFLLSLCFTLTRTQTHLKVSLLLLSVPRLPNNLDRLIRSHRLSHPLTFCFSKNKRIHTHTHRSAHTRSNLPTSLNFIKLREIKPLSSLSICFSHFYILARCSLSAKKSV